MNPEERQVYLERLRAAGFDDALNGRSGRSQALPGPEDRRAYLRGYEEGYFRRNPECEAELSAPAHEGEPAFLKRGEHATTVSGETAGSADASGCGGETAPAPKERT